MVDSSFYKIKMCLCQVEVWIYLYSAHNMDPHVHIGSNERGKENTPHTRGKTQTNKQKQTANTGITKGWLGGSPPLMYILLLELGGRGMYVYRNLDSKT